MNNFNNLKVWDLSHELTLEIYRYSKLFPKEEIYGLTSQLRRASYSIPSNISEGAGRNSIKEYLHFLSISFGSANELKYFLRLVRDLNYISENNYKILEDKVDHVQKMLYKLITYNKNRTT